MKQITGSQVTVILQDGTEIKSFDTSAIPGKQESMSTEAAAIVVKRPERTPKPPNPLRERVHQIEADLCMRIVERQRPIHGLLVAALAGEHVLLIGPPGTAKSQLARGFAGSLSGATYFEWLLTKFTTPEELYGPISLAGLKSDAFRRVTTGKLPEAHVAFLDEIFKANSAVLNSLLASVNERVFHDDGQAKPIPLMTCVGASNELPDTQDLAAIYDRFVMRFHVDPISQEAGFLAMLAGASTPPPAPISFQEWEEIRTQVGAVHINPPILKLLYTLRTSLRNAGVAVSDRRWVKATKILRAQAWMQGSSSVGSSHFRVLPDMLWDKPDQLPAITKIVESMCSTEIAAAKKIVESMQLLTNQLATFSGTQWSQAAASLRTELKKAVAKLTEQANKATDETTQDELYDLIEDLRAQGATVTAQLRAELKMDF